MDGSGEEGDDSSDGVGVGGNSVGSSRGSRVDVIVQDGKHIQIPGVPRLGFKITRIQRHLECRDKLSAVEKKRMTVVMVEMSRQRGNDSTMTPGVSR